jgi:hypothetical protein
MLVLLVGTSSVLAGCTSQRAVSSTSTSTTPAASSTTTPALPPTTTSLPPPACTPPGCASAAQVRRFVALADAGPTRAFVATYRLLDTTRPPITFVYTSSGGGLGSVYTYEVSAGGTRFRAVHLATGQSPTNFYVCMEDGARPWSCYGPDPSQGNGGIFEVQSYNVAPDYLLLFHPPADGSTIATRQIRPFESTCLTYTFQSPQAPTTWCVTSDGILDYYAGLNLNRPIELLSISMGVPPGAFELPATPTKWPAGPEHFPGRNTVFTGPGFDM